MDAQNDEEAVERVYRALWVYLDVNTAAADTIEGIRRWWLLDQPAALRARHIMEAALDRVVRAGRLIRRPGVDGRVLYAAVPPGDDPEET